MYFILQYLDIVINRKENLRKLERKKREKKIWKNSIRLNMLFHYANSVQYA